MRGSGRAKGARKCLGRVLGSLSLALYVGITAAAAVAGSAEKPGVSSEETLRQGERIYRDGLTPSGEPITALVQGDIEVDGTMFSCESCHLRSGLGSFEGGVVTPPTNGKTLYAPYDHRPEVGEAGMGMMGSAVKARLASIYLMSRYDKFPTRPAYTDETLAAALENGVDPTGREFDPVMPRYHLDKPDMALLVAYLKSLSAQPSPGVTATTIRFATVITEEVGQQERDAMLRPLEVYLGARNNQGLTANNMVRRGRLKNVVDPNFRELTLARWELKGPAETWRSQLEEYYRKEPVFALLGGITTGEWKPIHDFCEQNRIPCLFPITDFPVVSSTDWYTLYFSKGFYQEGQAAARHIGRTEGISPEATVAQVYPDTPAGRAFATGFREAWSELDRRAPVDRPLPADADVKAFLRTVTEQDHPAILALWLGAEAWPALEAVASGGNAPKGIYASASLLQDKVLALPETLRDVTYLTYPYALSAPPLVMGGVVQRGLGPKPPVPITDRRIARKMVSLCSALSLVLQEWESDFYRDYALDLIDGTDAVVDSPYERLSFGPGQRYASKGCFVVQVTHGADPTVEPRSGWVIH
jgi:hypothetical protein